MTNMKKFVAYMAAVFGLTTTAWAANVAQIGETKYETLSAAVAASKSGDTIKLLADVENIGTISLKDGVTFDGDGKKITGASALYCCSTGASVIKNVVFENIHNDSPISEENRELYGFPEGAIGTQSAIYAEGFASGSITITGCTFDNCDWDAIQIVPTGTSNGTISITDNIFKHTDDTKRQLRHIHIQCTGSYMPKLVVTATDNQLYDCEKGVVAFCVAGYMNGTGSNYSGNYISDVSMVDCAATYDIKLGDFYPMRSQPTVDVDDIDKLAMFDNVVYYSADDLVAAINSSSTAYPYLYLYGNVSSKSAVVIDNSRITRLYWYGGGTAATGGHLFAAPSITFNVPVYTGYNPSFQIEDAFVANKKFQAVSGTYSADSFSGTLEVTGGTYNKDVSAYVNENKSLVTDNGNGTWTVEAYTDQTAVADGKPFKTSIAGYFSTLQAALNVSTTVDALVDINENVNCGSNYDTINLRNMVSYTGSLVGQNKIALYPKATYTTAKEINLTSVTCPTFIIGSGKTWLRNVTIGGGKIGRFEISSTCTVTTLSGNTEIDEIVLTTYYYTASPYAKATLTITGGTYGTIKCRASATATETPLPNDALDLTITGGTFGFDPTRYVADGYVSTDNGNGTWTVGKICVAQITRAGATAKYETLAEAVAAAQPGDVITVLADVELADKLTVTKRVILDLNGKTISHTANCQSTEYHMIDVGVGGDLTIKDTAEGGTIVFTGNPYDTGYGVQNATIYNCGGKLTLESGTVKNLTGGGLTYAIVNSSNAWADPITSIFEMKGGVVSAPHGDAAFRQYMNAGETVQSVNTVNISGGTIPDTGIFVDTFSYQQINPNMVGTLNITGGTINGLIDFKIRNDRFTANISGGTFANAKLWARLAEATYLPNGVSDPFINITGGTWNFVGTAFGLGYDTMTTTWKDGANPFAVAGGTFSEAIPENSCAAGFIPTSTTVDGVTTYGVKTGAYVAQIGATKYETLAAAFAAAKAGDTMTLLADVDLEGAVWTPVTFNGTFDGQGHTISNFKINDKTYGAGFFSDLYGTVKNLTIDGATVGSATSSGNITGVLAGYSHGDVVVENVIVQNSRIHGYGKVGGLIGMAEVPGSTTTLTNCKVKDTVVAGTYNVGGLVGLVLGKIEIPGTVTENAILAGDASSYYQLNTTVASVTYGGVTFENEPVKGCYWYSSGWYFAGIASLYNRYVDEAKTTESRAKTIDAFVCDVPVENPVAKIDYYGYASLEAAVIAANNIATANPTIKLMQDVTIPETLEINNVNRRTITINGQGHNITAAKTLCLVKTPLQFKGCDGVGEASSGLVSWPVDLPLFVEDGGAVSVTGGIYTKAVPEYGVNAHSYYFPQNAEGNYVYSTLNDEAGLAMGYRVHTSNPGGSYYESISAVVATKSSGTCSAYLLEDVNEDVVSPLTLIIAGPLPAKNYSGSVSLPTGKALSLYCNATINSLNLTGTGKYPELKVGFTSAEKYGRSAVTIKDGTVSAVTINAFGDLVIEGGVYTGAIKVNTATSGDKGTLVIKGGTFSTDPSAYVAEGYEAVAQGTTPETWVVAQKTIEIVVPADPEEGSEEPAEQEMAIVIPQQVLVEDMNVDQAVINKLVSGTADEKREAAQTIQTVINTSQANNLTVWQNYVMGVNGTQATNALKPVEGQVTTTEVEELKEEVQEEAKKEKVEPVVIETPINSFDKPAGTGVTVKYNLIKGKMVDGEIVWNPVPVKTLDTPRYVIDMQDETGDTFWKIEAVFTGATR